MAVARAQQEGAAVAEELGSDLRYDRSSVKGIRESTHHLLYYCMLLLGSFAAFLRSFMIFLFSENLLLLLPFLLLLSFLPFFGLCGNSKVHVYNQASYESELRRQFRSRLPNGAVLRENLRAAPGAFRADAAKNPGPMRFAQKIRQLDIFLNMSASFEPPLVERVPGRVPGQVHDGHKVLRPPLALLPRPPVVEAL